MRNLSVRWYDSAAKKSKGFYIKEPKASLTQSEVETVMGNLITLKVIPSNYAVDYAAVIDTQKNELFNLI
ncbi:hypothetical protein V512_010630 [Mesotoga sp. Brook.08.105.5.1]|jgi:hypothetical protein|nr:MULTISPECIES: DUF2922 family protein [unclassified Mesotoga]PVD17367.1 hypothetical protein V512_010630 [Mesotoga sp. Brook.08.105.5.1]RAO98307.1 hypothetical protein M388_00310 [Mesotoga sp. Brook.08.YT.4.2.5.4.]